MYAALWRVLPGPPAAKAAQCLILAITAVAFCFLWLFPRIAPYMPFNDGTVDTPTTGQTSQTSTSTQRSTSTQSSRNTLDSTASPTSVASARP
ncbi:MAG TPA: hypothetical protein VFJ22_18485 [Dermatophilaceae bacterium]|jgi:hypothetical protein|nr:hypothetical protein [Dermatophilaceae bacterium]